MEDFELGLARDSGLSSKLELISLSPRTRSTK